MLAGCEKGDAEAWQVFLSRFSPITYRLLHVYAPKLDESTQKAVWKEALQALTANDYQQMRDFDHQAEREFLMDLKWFVLGLAAGHTSESAGRANSSAEEISTSLKGKSIAHLEIILLALAGYSPADIEKVYAVPAALVGAALAPPTSENSAGEIISLKPEGWLQVLPEIRSQNTPECTPRRTFVRILDGQASWNDKNVAETHMVGCLHCLETWASLREIDYLRRDTPPLSPSDVEGYLELLPVAAAVTSRTWMSKLLGR